MTRAERLGLEPEAVGAEPCERDALDYEVRHSIAISLKRIADALTGTGSNFLTAPINSYGEGIGDAIQGQMIRGQRGVDQYEAGQP